MQVEILKISELKPYEKNPRINDEAIEKVAQSIQDFGFNVPILLDEDKSIVAGHTRYEAAKSLGIKEVPCIILTDLDEDKIAQYRIIDNKTAELSSWNFDKLFSELDQIVDVDMSIYQFDTGTDPEEEDEESDEVTGNLYDGCEIELDAYDEEAFDIECPYCGFRWNE